MHAISSYRGNRHTQHKHTHTQTNIHDRLQYTAPQLVHSVINAANVQQPEKVEVDYTGGNYNALVAVW